MTGSKDLTCRVWTLMPTEGFVPMVLAGHKDQVTACFFSTHDTSIAYTIAADCAIFVWQWQADNEDEEEEEEEEEEEGENGGAFFLDSTGSGSNTKKSTESMLDAALAHFGGAGSSSSSSSSSSGGIGASSSSSSSSLVRRRVGRRLHPALGRWALRAKHFLWDQAEAVYKKKKASRRRTGLGGGGEDGETDDGESGALVAADGSSGRHGVGLRVRCAELHRPTSLLAIGLSNGTFSLFDLRDALPDQMGYLPRSHSGGSAKQRRLLNGSGGADAATLALLKGSSHTLQALHTLSISQSDVGTVAINGGGEWLAFGAAPLGQLLVWEWQSETYVLKQQGHSYDMNDVAFSPDGQSACVLRRYRELS